MAALMVWKTLKRGLDWSTVCTVDGVYKGEVRWRDVQASFEEGYCLFVFRLCRAEGRVSALRSSGVWGAGRGYLAPSVYT